MTRSVPIFQVDAFTSEPFAGNPAAVCLLDAAVDPAWMQDVAAEMNLSETAFYLPDSELSLRWFTPTTEVELCGHATLATAHVLWSEGRVPPSEAIGFDTLSGKLSARPDDGWITLDLPSRPPGPADLSPDVARALGIDVVGTGSNSGWVVVEVATEKEVAAARPDMDVLRDSGQGYIVTAPAGADVVCRVFVPAFGVDEDPVTGSAQCLLGPWWTPRLGVEELTVRQISRRGGTLRVRVTGDRVLVSGQAVTTLRGSLIRSDPGMRR